MKREAASDEDITVVLIGLSPLAQMLHRHPDVLALLGEPSLRGLRRLACSARASGRRSKSVRQRKRMSAKHYSAASRRVPCGRRPRKCGRISSAIAVMFASAMSFGMVPNWVLVSDVLKPARS